MAISHHPFPIAMDVSAAIWAICTVILPLLGCVLLVVGYVYATLRVAHGRVQTPAGRALVRWFTSWRRLAVLATLLVCIPIATNIVPNWQAVLIPNPSPTTTRTTSVPTQPPPSTSSPSMTHRPPTLAPYPSHRDTVVVDKSPETFINDSGDWKIGDYSIALSSPDGEELIAIQRRGRAATIKGCDGAQPVRLRIFNIANRGSHPLQYVNLTLGISDAQSDPSLDIVGTVDTYDRPTRPLQIRYGEPARVQLDVRNTVNVDISLALNPTNPKCANGEVRLVYFDAQDVFSK